jgi:hypothetical protein
MVKAIITGSMGAVGGNAPGYLGYRGGVRG